MFAFQLKEPQMLQVHSIKLWPLTSILAVKKTRIHKITRGNRYLTPSKL